MRLFMVLLPSQPRRYENKLGIIPGQGKPWAGADVLEDGPQGCPENLAGEEAPARERGAWACYREHFKERRW